MPFVVVSIISFNLNKKKKNDEWASENGKPNNPSLK